MRLLTLSVIVFYSLLVGLVAEIAVVLVGSGITRPAISKLSGEHSEKDGHASGAYGHGCEEAELSMTAEHIQQSGITLEDAMEGDLIRTTTSPGSVVARVYVRRCCNGGV